MPATAPAAVNKAVQRGDPPPADLSAEERRAYEQRRTFSPSTWPTRRSRPPARKRCTGWRIHRPTWRRSCWTTATAPASPGVVEQALRGTLDSALTRDDILDNITLYWLTNTGISAARLYWEKKADFFDAKPITIPYAISVFPDELYRAPRSWAERAYPHNLIHCNRPDRGGHFAA